MSGFLLRCSLGTWSWHQKWRAGRGKQQVTTSPGHPALGKKGAVAITAVCTNADEATCWQRHCEDEWGWASSRGSWQTVLPQGRGRDGDVPLSQAGNSYHPFVSPRAAEVCLEGARLEEELPGPFQRGPFTPPPLTGTRQHLVIRTAAVLLSSLTFRNSHLSLFFKYHMVLRSFKSKKFAFYKRRT